MSISGTTSLVNPSRTTRSERSDNFYHWKKYQYDQMRPEFQRQESGGMLETTFRVLSVGISYNLTGNILGVQNLTNTLTLCIKDGTQIQS